MFCLVTEEIQAMASTRSGKCDRVNHDSTFKLFQDIFILFSLVYCNQGLPSQSYLFGMNIFEIA